MKKALFDFIKSSPTAYHAIDTVKRRLLSEGFSELYEADLWELQPFGKYFVIRGGSSIIAFVNLPLANGYTICASHSDYPAFKVKVTEEALGAYVSVPTEKYGGSIHYTWLDRPLSLAGRVMARTEHGIESRLVNLDCDALCIPSLAIHVNRGVNDGYKFALNKDMIPLLTTLAHKGELMERISLLSGVRREDILSHDLYLYVREEGREVGLNGEFVLCPRLDNLASVYSSLEAFLSAECKNNIPVLAVFDNEEVGSETKEGAKSDFLSGVLSRSSAEPGEHYRRLSSSFMASVDNAHAKHPNFPELSDPDNAPLLSAGIAIKYNANKRYATDGESDAIFRAVCEGAKIKLQSFTNRADMPGGSTLGALSETLLSIPTVDIGIPQLAMHSAVELAASADVSEMVSALSALYSASIKRGKNGISVG